MRRGRDAAAVRAVAAQAVLGVELLPLLDARAAAGLRPRGARQRERDGDRCERLLHAGWQGGSWTTPATPPSTIATRKSKFPSTAATAKKWRRPSGAASSYWTARVSQSVSSAAASASTTSTTPTPSSDNCHARTSTPSTAFAAPHRATATPNPSTSCADHVSAAPKRPNH